MNPHNPSALGSRHSFLDTVLSFPIPKDFETDSSHESSNEGSQTSESGCIPTPTQLSYSPCGAIEKSDRLVAAKEKIYSCTFSGCLKSFARKYNLNVHTRTHYPELARPFQCLECKKAFGRKHDLRRHLATVHQTTTLYRCSACDKPFARRDSLLKHEEKGCSASPTR
ncbi:hypothetical protein K493DRAFT_316512 [Basidiobolus meristosporus CBS 931.73]|uniref:C2H2-type domain-containing protein n=1 Tax=Basidiobolus meristosporus CBS 931.73 TaxID=1314790 RepID=A0A1Y1Y3Y0_9FUNG|nr:hypothetical protein K493DRAFT_316512 [Basidiobolus meristosporus CBS 931.73]|eukprot:ORX92595.1 hypothetical protein K493DRAFT_316512 [Basidiobolus meristosporus CBS 931.73]